MTTSTMTEPRNTLGRAVRALAQVCDGARTRDDHGFNGVDSDLGKSLALLPEPVWDPPTRRVAWEMLRKYRAQLAAMGIDFDSIPEPAVDAETPAPDRAEISKEVRSVASRVIRVSGPIAEVSLGRRFTTEMLHAVKALPDRRWGGHANPVWRVPSAFEQEIRRFADRFQFRIEGVFPSGQAPAVPRVRRVLLEDGKFVIEMPFEKAAIEQLRAFAGREWDRDRGRSLGEGMTCWKIPTRGNVAQVVGFARHHNLVLPPEIEQAARQAEERAAALKQASMALDGDVTVDGLAAGLSLLPYQRGGVVYMKTVRRGWIGDQMGLGKTIQAIATAQHERAYPVVCVVPAAVKINWVREWRKWVPGVNVEMLEGTRRGYVGLFGPADVYVVNYDILGTYDPDTEKMTGHLVDFVETVKPKALIVDESHFTKSSSAQRTQAVRKLGEQVRAGGKDALVMLLSGTPLVNRPDELIMQLDILGRLNEFGGASRFKQRYCKTNDHLTELNDRLRASCYLRRQTKDVLKDLPPIRRIPVEAELDAAVMAEYKKAEDDVAEYLAERARQLAVESGLDDDDARNAYWQKKLKAQSAEHLVLIGTLKQILARAKMGWAKKWAENFLASTDGKLLLFGTHKPIVGGLADALHAPRIDGDEGPGARRQAVIDDFQENPKTRLCVLSMDAGGVGLTLTAAESVAFIEQGWTPATHDQAEGRCYGRVNEAHGATSYYLLAMEWDGQETIDAMIWDLIRQKRQVVDAVTDGKEPTGETSVLGEVVLNLARRGLKGRRA